MFWYEIVPPVKEMEALSRRVEQQPIETLRRIEDLVLPEVQAIVQERLATEPPPPTYPLNWLSAQQRIAAILAIKEKQRGKLPYKRTHRLSGGWRLMLTAGTMSIAYTPTQAASGQAFKAGLGETKRFGAEGGDTSIALRNPTPWTKYVQGLQRQQFHEDTGWQKMDDVREEVQQRAQPLIVQAWQESIPPP